MNRKERRAEAKQNHNINKETTNQEETMNENITTETAATVNQTTSINSNEENITMEQNTSQPGLFTRIKNAFINGYRETKTCIKEQVQEIKETYVSSLEENGNVIVKHTKAVVKTAIYITVKTLKNLWAIIAWPFIKIDSIIDRKVELVATA